MKVLLVYPPVTLHKLDVSHPTWCSPLGLAYVATAISKAGHDVHVLNCLTPVIPGTPGPSGQKISDDFTRYGLLDEQIREVIKSEDPCVVGVACMYTPYFKDAHNVARIVKEWNKDTLVMFGGAHTSTFPEVVMKDENVDAVVIGEGERTVCELLERHGAGESFNGVTGIWHRSGGEVKDEPPREFIENLDEIPFPDWDLMKQDMEHARALSMRNRFMMRHPVGRLLTSRGCPKECYFCSVKLAWSRRWRGRSAKNVVDEIESLKKKYGYREFHFIDDNSSVSRKRMYEICDEILTRELDIKLVTPTGIAIGNLDRDLLARMKEAGFYRLCFGMESGSPETQKIIKKRIDLDKAREVIAEANRLGFWTSGTFIMGFPHETEKEIRKTIDFMKTSNIDFPVAYLLTPQPRTEVYEILHKEGLIDLEPYLDPHSDEWYRISITYGNGARNRHLTNQELQSLLSRGYREFLIHKLFSVQTYINLFRKVRSFEDVRYLLGLMTYPLNVLRQMIVGASLSSNSLRRKRGALHTVES